MVAQGWCPSTYRLFGAEDGLLARVKVPGGIVTTTQWSAVGTAAATFGNGVVEITSRANLQLRGIEAGAADALRSSLADAGLIAPTEGAEDRRNVLASPTAGLDPSVLLDVRPVVRSVVAALDGLDDEFDPDLVAALPHKFGVLVDGGGRHTLRGRGLDVTLGARRLVVDGSVVFELGLGASLPAAGRSEVLEWTVAAGDVAAVVAATASVSAAPPRGAAPGRIVDLVATLGSDAVMAAVEDRCGGRTTRRAPGALADLTTELVDGPPLGIRDEARGGRRYVGLAGPSTLRSDDIGDLARVLETFGLDEVRLTPWRTVVVPGVAADSADRFTATAADHGWTTGAAAHVRSTVGADR